MKARTALICGLLGLAWLGISPAGSSADGVGASSGKGVAAINISPQIAGDDHRYVAFQRKDGVPVVLDTWNGRTRSLDGARYCQPRDIGGRRVLLICPGEEASEDDTGFRARTGSVLGGPTRLLARAHRLVDAYGIGRFWVSIDIRTQPNQTPAYYFLNWRNGNIRGVWPELMRRGRDLDSRKLKPLRVKAFEPRFERRPGPSETPPTVCRGRDVVVTDWKQELRLWWSRDRSVRLGKGGMYRYECEWHESLRIGSGRVTWSRGPVVHAYDYRTGHRFRQRHSSGARVMPVRDGVVIAERIRKADRYTTVYRLRLKRL